MNVLYDDAAKRELADAVTWYAADSAHNAERFLAAVESLTSVIAAMPERFPRIAREARRARLKHFPYMIIYVHDEQGLWIGALAHVKRRPGYWLERLA